MLTKFEKMYWPELVMGIDEAGRGPLAGPLVVAGVIFPAYFHNDLINDSKKLSKKNVNNFMTSLFKNVCIMIFKL